MKNTNWTFPVVPDLTWKLGFVSNILSMIVERGIFRRDLQWSVGPKHLALTAWKVYYFIVRIVSVCYVWTEDCNICLHEALSNLVLFLCHSGIYFSVALLFMQLFSCLWLAIKHIHIYGRAKNPSLLHFFFLLGFSLGFISLYISFFKNFFDNITFKLSRKLFPHL